MKPLLKIAAFCIFSTLSTQAFADIVYMGNGLYCDRVVARVDGMYDSTTFMDCFYADPPGGGGSGGSSPPGGSDDDPICSTLELQRPNDCAERKSKPNSAQYGAPQYGQGSALHRSIGLMQVLAPFRSVDPNYPAQINAALLAQTQAIADLNGERSVINGVFLDQMRSICSNVHHHYNVLREQLPFPPDNPSQDEKACWNTTIQIAREMGSPSTMQQVLNAFEWAGIDISDLIPQSLLDWLAPGNSLHTKWELVVSDAQCALWWNSMDQAGCSAP